MSLPGPNDVELVGGPWDGQFLSRLAPYVRIDDDGVPRVSVEARSLLIGAYELDESQYPAVWRWERDDA